MEKLWKVWQRRLIPLTSRNRSLVVPKARPRFCLDFWGFDFLGGLPAHQWIEKALLTTQPIPLFPVVDPRDGRSNDRSLALQGLLKTVRIWKEETGSAPLHLGYPVVEGKTSQDQVVRGPLILIPVEIDMYRGKWVLIPQPPTWNQAFLLLYGQSTGQMPPLEWPWEMSEISSLLDFLTKLHAWISQYLPGLRMDSALFQQTLQPYPAWRIQDLQKKAVGELSLLSHALLGIFPSYSSYLGEDYTYLSQLYPQPPWSLWNTEADEKIREEWVLDPLPVDASQEYVLNRVQQGASMVVQGPPGSGKSQLITNLVARFTAQGKRVLVVCQKRAALETVYERLQELGADSFVGFVTDIQRDRPEIFSKLRHHLAQLSEYQNSTNQWEAWFQDRNFRQASRRIDQYSEDLEVVRVGLFSPLPMGWPLKNIYLALGDLPAGPHWDSPVFHQWSEDRYAEKEHGIRLFLKYIRALENSIDFIENGRLRHVWGQQLSELGHLRWNQYQNSRKVCFPLLAEWAGGYDDSILQDFWTWWKKCCERPTSLRWLRVPIPKGVNLTTENQLAHWAGEVIISDQWPLEAWENLLSNRKRQPWRRIVGLPKALQAVRLPGESEDALKNRILQSIAWKGFKATHAWCTAQTPAEWLDIWQDIRWIRPLRGKYTHCSWEKREDSLPFEMAWERFTLDEQAWLEEVGDYWQVKFREGPSRALEQIESMRPILFELSQLSRGWHEEEYRLVKLCQEDSEWPIKLRRSWLHYWRQFGEKMYPEVSRLGVGHWQEVEDQLQEAIEAKQATVRTQWIQSLKAQTVRDLTHNRLRNPTTFRPLQHQIQKKRQLWSLRKVWQEFSEEVSRLLPCWLTSPEAAASMFPLGKEPSFDLVIFDEASQCPVEHGIPILFRGKQVVIAGDQHQLRPSDLYQAVWEEEEEEEPELSLDSLLDLASWHLPTLELRGHYRSAHPDLIEFSNQHFYQNKLHCLPTFSIWKRGEPALVYHGVQGKWDGRINELEAEYILNLIDSWGSITEKVGIITFNYHQARRIEQGIDERGWTHVRVKNIENVQGDEYDIVVLSTTYGPNAKGNIQFQMGSLNRPGGENRLNVALTRARKKMHVVSSLPLASLRDSEEHAEGVQKLKAFLLQTARYQQNGQFSEARVPMGLAARLINQKPFQPTPFGLLDTQDTLWLTDDEAYENSVSPKEIHAYFPRSLRQKGWKYRRVWSYEWATGTIFGRSPQ